MYKEYIKSDQWKIKRWKKKKKIKYCQRCWCRDYLEVHHWTYKRLWNENMLNNTKKFIKDYDILLKTFG